jgi:flagellar protein FliT
MMTGDEIVASYEEFWAITQLMSAAAKKSEWDDLATLETKRFALMEKLMVSDVGDLSDTRLNAKKSELIRNILDSDAETKKLTEAWMVELRQILDSIGAEKKLNDAYAGYV